MAKSYFIVEKGIIERDDLSIYEKMCCVVLAKWASESLLSFNMSTLASEMSCTERKAKETIQKLQAKGFIVSEGKEDAELKIPNIIKAEQIDGLEPISFESTPMSKLSKEDMIGRVRELIDEPINDSEARIILNFANEDFDRIEFCYKKAKKMQVSDKVEALMMELQRKEKPVAPQPAMDAVAVAEKNQAPRVETEINQTEKPWYLDDDDDGVDDVIKAPSGNQINTNMLNKMKAYGKLGK